VSSPPRDARLAVVGLPWEGGAPYGGSEFGPASVREVSINWPKLIVGKSRQSFRRCYDLGDISAQRLDAERFFERVTVETRSIYEAGAILGAVGGDHSVAFPLVRTLYRVPLHFIVFDAHRDFDGEPPGAPRSAAPIHRFLSRRIAELPHIAKILQIGVRDCVPEEIRREQKERGIRTFTPRMIRSMGRGQILREIEEGASLYLSVDLDVLDPSIAPGVTEPAADGLHYRELKALLTEIVQRGRLIGFDITELNPTYDPGGFTALMGARVLATFLSLVS